MTRQPEVLSYTIQSARSVLLHDTINEEDWGKREAASVEAKWQQLNNSAIEFVHRAEMIQ